MGESVTTFSFVLNDPDARLDQAIVSRLASDCRAAPSRSRVGRWIREGRVEVDGAACRKPGFRSRTPVQVSVAPPAIDEGALEPDAAVRFDIVFEDPHVLVVNKPANLVVHPGAGAQHATLVHGILAHVGSSILAVGHPLRPGIVHRLDKDTTGLLVVAKTAAAYHHLVRQFLPPRQIHRTYYALCYHEPVRGHDEGQITLAVARSIKNPTKMTASSTRGRSASTYWRVRERLKTGVLLELELETGRTHQIRVHLAASGSAIVGDPSYGALPQTLHVEIRKAIRAFGRQALHAAELSFLHPDSKERVSFTAPLPDDMQQLLAVLKSGPL